MQILQGTQSLLDVTQHLKNILLGESRETLRDDFMQRASQGILTPKRHDLLRDYASPTAQDIPNENAASALWHGFTDALKKRICVIPLLPKEGQESALMELAVFSRWNIENYAMFIDGCMDSPTPAYPAAPWKIQTFPDLLCYIKQSYLPTLEASLAISQGVSQEEMGQRLTKLEAELITAGLEGIEIFKPIPRSAWNSDVTLAPV